MLIILWAALTGVLMATTFMGSPFGATLMLVTASSMTGMMFLMIYLNWLFYSVIILFVGGMMTLFLYLCCLDVSSKVSTKSKGTMLILVISGFTQTYSSMFFLEETKPLCYFLNMNSSMALITLGVYLLLGLCVSMKFANKFTGPLKPVYMN